jgi:hypothetical protein
VAVKLDRSFAVLLAQVSNMSILFYPWAFLLPRKWFRVKLFCNLANLMVKFIKMRGEPDE